MCVVALYKIEQVLFVYIQPQIQLTISSIYESEKLKSFCIILSATILHVIANFNSFCVVICAKKFDILILCKNKNYHETLIGFSGSNEYYSSVLIANFAIVFEDKDGVIIVDFYF